MSDCKKNKCGCKTKAPPKKKPEPQNGKGDAPRNLSNEFRDNYDSINWKTKKK